MLTIIEKFNQLVFTLISPKFYKKLPVKTIAISGALLAIIIVIVIAGFSIRAFFIKDQIVKTHNILVKYIETVKNLDETVQDIDSLDSSMTTASSVHRYEDDVKQYETDYAILKKNHAELKKIAAKAPSKDTEAYYGTIREFDTMAFDEYSTGSALLKSGLKMVKVSAVARQQKLEDVSMNNIASKEDLLNRLDTIKTKMKAVQDVLVVIKGDEYFDVFYTPLHSWLEKMTKDFDDLTIAIKNEDMITLERLSKELKNDVPDMDSIDTYKLEKAVSDSKKRVSKLNTLSPKLTSQERTLIKAYSISTEQELPYFYKQNLFQNMDSYKEHKLLDLPVKTL